MEERLKKLEEYVKNHEEDIKNNRIGISSNSNKIQSNTSALELLHDFKEVANRGASTSKMFFTMWLVTFVAFIGLLGYTLYLLNDIGVETTTQEITDFESIDGNIINRGDMYGES